MIVKWPFFLVNWPQFVYIQKSYFFRGNNCEITEIVKKKLHSCPSRPGTRSPGGCARTCYLINEKKFSVFLTDLTSTDTKILNFTS